MISRDLDRIRSEEPTRGAAPRSKRLEGASVLLVEDEDDLRELGVVVLQSEGARVTGVGSATEALDALAATPIDVVLTDISLPDMDGFELVARIQAQRHDVPVIAVTGYDGPEERARALERGFARYVTKPATGEDLVAAVAAVRQGPRAPAV